MTREQRLRELVHRWRWQRIRAPGVHDTCADELETILNEESEGWLPINYFDIQAIAEEYGLDYNKFCAALVNVSSVLAKHFNDEDAMNRWAMKESAPTLPADGSEK